MGYEQGYVCCHTLQVQRWVHMESLVSAKKTATATEMMTMRSQLSITV